MGVMIGRGGEGTVFALEDGSSKAVKIYAVPDAAREAKVRSMVGADLARKCPGVAFPESVVIDEVGSFAGFAMPLIQGCQQIHELYTPASRRRAFPAADWRFLIRAATNVARLFVRIHAVGAVVGDVNGSGLLVSRQAVAAAIDADSFQLGKEHLCRVGVIEFTPPELQGSSLDGVLRTVDHDGFGLAVMIFLLLFLGRHPHAGRPAGRDVPLGAAIRDSHFAYSLVRTTRLLPPPGTLLLSDLPGALRNRFERAFAPLSTHRPTPQDWVDELERTEAGLTTCDRNDRHQWAKGPQACPWCRIERTTGTSCFGQGERSARPVVPIDPSGSAAQMAAARTLKRARGGSGEAVMPTATAAAGTNRQAAAGRAESSWAPLVEDGERLALRYVGAADHLGRTLASWRDRTGAWTAHRAAAALREAFNRTARMENLQDAEIAEARTALMREAIGTELRRTKLADATTLGTTTRQCNALFAAGIVSAADVSRTALERIRGIGEQTLMAAVLWRHDLEAQLERRIAVPAEEVASAVAAIRTKWRSDRQASDLGLARMAKELDRMIDEVDAAARRPDALIDAAVAAFESARVGLRHAGMSERRAREIAADAAARSDMKAEQSSDARKYRGKGCPLCGGPMVKRWARTGSTSGRYFHGCAAYPKCSGSRSFRAP